MTTTVAKQTIWTAAEYIQKRTDVNADANSENVVKIMHMGKDDYLKYGKTVNSGVSGSTKQGLTTYNEVRDAANLLGKLTIKGENLKMNVQKLMTSTNAKHGAVTDFSIQVLADVAAHDNDPNTVVFLNALQYMNYDLQRIVKTQMDNKNVCTEMTKVYPFLVTKLSQKSEKIESRGKDIPPIFCLNFKMNDYENKTDKTPTIHIMDIATCKTGERAKFNGKDVYSSNLPEYLTNNSIVNHIELQFQISQNDNTGISIKPFIKLLVITHRPAKVQGFKGVNVDESLATEMIAVAEASKEDDVLVGAVQGSLTGANTTTVTATAAATTTTTSILLPNISLDKLTLIE